MKSLIYRLFFNKTYKRKAFVILFDICCFILIDSIYYLMSVSTKESLPIESVYIFNVNSAILCLSMLAVKLSSRIYSTVWRYGNPYDYINMIFSDVMGCALALFITIVIKTYNGVWQIATVGAITLVLELSSRFIYRLIYLHEFKPQAQNSGIPTAIIGAGEIGLFLANYLRSNSSIGYSPVFFVDTNEEKIGSRISDIPVYSVKRAEKEIADQNIKNVIIAITRKDRDLSEIYNHYASLGCSVKIYDILSENMNSGAGKKIRDFTIEDLLFRKPLSVTDDESLDYYKDKTILITGGGGSIGSELCRQIAECGPKKLIIFDIYENNAYDIQQELKYKYGDKLSLDVCIGSVRDTARLESVFEQYRPDVVFHAAAHKHVPLMENNSCEAVKNNVLGTYNAANAAEKFGVKRFLLISTDKAVNPTNIMGASKRVCEMIIQCRKDSKTSFSAVRFGNVLGSNGSVIPLFRKQIEAGGPVTVTDKRVIRYFMTISEAASLVIQAGAMAKHGELFVLDMGRPVKIIELAENMIRLSGYEPYTDIAIKEIGLRPGEKLYEELLIKSEHLDKTGNSMIFIERDEPFARDEIDEKVRILTEAADKMSKGDGAAVQKAMKKTVSTYKDPNEVNRCAAESEEMKRAAIAV